MGKTWITIYWPDIYRGVFIIMCGLCECLCMIMVLVIICTYGQRVWPCRADILCWRAKAGVSALTCEITGGGALLLRILAWYWWLEWVNISDCIVATNVRSSRGALVGDFTVAVPTLCCITGSIVGLRD